MVPPALDSFRSRWSAPTPSSKKICAKPPGPTQESEVICWTAALTPKYIPCSETGAVPMLCNSTQSDCPGRGFASHSFIVTLEAVLTVASRLAEPGVGAVNCQSPETRPNE